MHNGLQIIGPIGGGGLIFRIHLAYGQKHSKGAGFTILHISPTEQIPVQVGID
jgi:hypothetical protein